MYKTTNPDLPTVLESGDLGLKLHWPFFHHDFAVDVRVIGIQNLRYVKNSEERAWESIYLENGVVAHYAHKFVKWSHGEDPEFAVVPQLKLLSEIVSQFVWVDEPIGHAIQLGYEVFLTVEECYAVFRKGRKAKKHRMLYKWRRNALRELARQRGVAAEDLNFPERRKKIYARRG